ncbi:MAG: 4-hydroxy-3-methylbut-2-enyl diphosphate reductase [Defluviitaleaceae bacterium]|nr:4-hydroxy-3-methylbut-2-enyl diphosphate reductase [Defluviitaleaceae bacterium]
MPEIRIAASAGFCFGVGRIVNAVKKLSDKHGGGIYTIGPVIHNKAVVAELEELGIRSVADVSELKTIPRDKIKAVVIRSHGVPPHLTRELCECGYNLYDYTCPDVAKVQKSAANAGKNGYGLIIAGDKNHPEIIGIRGFYEEHGRQAIIVANEREASDSIFPDTVKYDFIAQTTFDAEEYGHIEYILNHKHINFTTHQTLCRGTTTRYTEAKKLAKTCDIMLVLGDKNSSNTRKLFEICERENKNTFFIENLYKIDKKLLKFLKESDMIIGVTAGASTPPAMMQKIREQILELRV